MNPSDLPTITERKTYKSLEGLRKWWASLGEDSTLSQDDDINNAEAALPSRSFLSRSSTGPNAAAEPNLSRSSTPSLRRADAFSSQRRQPQHLRHRTAVLQTSAADKFLGTAATSTDRKIHEHLPPFIIHPLDWKYRLWWNLTVVIAAITSILEPFVIAFTEPGLYPYDSATSILEYICIILIFLDMIVSFNVARYVNGELVTNRKELAQNYMKMIFWVDLLSIIPFDQIALAIAGLAGSNFVKNPELAQYLSLLKLIRMLRMYRLNWFFSYLTYNLASPLLLVTLLRNLFYTFFLANFAACAFYFEALQAGFGPNTWVGANAEWFVGANTSQMYIYSLYWSMATLSTTGYGDIRAYNAVEAGMLAFWMLFLIFFTAYIYGSITLLVVKSDERAGKYRDQMRALQGYATLHSLPQELRDSMQRHLKLHFYNADAADEQVLRAYPASIRRRVLRQLYLPTIRSCYLFAGAKPRFIDALLSVARVELYLPQVEILSHGDYVNDLFIIVAGHVQCLQGQMDRESSIHGGNKNTASGAAHTQLNRPSFASTIGRSSVLGAEDGSYADATSLHDHSVHAGGYGGPVKVLDEGSVFGEVAFFTGTAQVENVTTLSACRVLAISRTAFEQVSAMFPTSKKIVLMHLERHGEDTALELFPGPLGVELFRKAMADELRGGVVNTTGTGDAALTGGDPTLRINPLRSQELQLTARQELAIASLLQVRGVVSRAVAKHDADRVTEWLYAATHADAGKLREMLGHGFDPNSADYDQRTALMLASSRGFRDLVQLLLDAGADPNLVDAFGGTALFEACKAGHDDIISLLVSKGAHVGMSSMKQASMLCTAVDEGDLKLIRRVLQAGIDVNACDYDLRTALHIAASRGNVAAVELLAVEGGADLQRKDRWGNTPFDEAVRVGATAVARFLKAELDIIEQKNGDS